MIIKRYIVDNMNEAMVKIRYELGNDAVIVSQRKIRQKGFKGLFKPKKIEVTAAVDDKSRGKNEKAEEKDSIHEELREIRDIMSSMMNQQVDFQGSRTKVSRNGINKRLLENDIPEEIIDDIYKKVKDISNVRANSKQFENEFKKIIESYIKTNSNMDGRIHAFIGPTGVGKTTTIAKLASFYSLYKNKKVGLITIDTYRIGAVEQLKIYAGILSSPFGVVISPKDIQEVLKSMEDCDMIFVDTTGRNSKNAMQVSETRRFIEELKPDEVHLVLSMTTKQKDIKSIVDNYRLINYGSLILTKLDETEACGSILSALYYANVPVSFIADGQNVPEDLKPAEEDRLLQLIMGEDE